MEYVVLQLDGQRKKEEDGRTRRPEQVIKVSK
jgi:hypothetical protein